MSNGALDQLPLPPQQLVSIALPPLPKFFFISFQHFFRAALWSLGNGQYKSNDFLRTSILWMFQDHPVNCPNMGRDDVPHWDHHRILAEHGCLWLLRRTEGLKRSGED